MRYMQFLAGAVTVTVRAGAQDVPHPWPEKRAERDRYEHTSQFLHCQTEIAVAGEGGITTPPRQDCATRTFKSLPRTYSKLKL